MKKVKIPEINKSEIDWSKPQWVQHIEHIDLIVLTTGLHSLGYFKGTCLPCEHYPSGEYRLDWINASFKLLTDDITFIISNKD